MNRMEVRLQEVVCITAESGSSSPQTARAQRYGRQFAAHAQVLPDNGGDGGRDEVSQPPCPGVRQAAIAHTHQQKQDKQSHCKIQALQHGKTHTVLIQ